MRKIILIIMSVGILASLIIPNLVGGNAESTPSTEKRQKDDLANDSEFVGLAQALIIGNGYLCNNLHRASQTPWNGNFHVACDDYKRMYVIEENAHTGEWIVTPD